MIFMRLFCYICRKMPRTKNAKYSQEAVENAAESIKNGSMSLRKAAEHYGVPRSTISDRVNHRFPNPGKLGRPPAIPFEVEVKIVNAVKAASQQGIGVTRQQLLSRVGALCRSMGTSPFKKAIPSKDYWLLLKKRHGLTIRKSEKLQTSRASMLNQTVVSKYFKDLQQLIEDTGLLEKPSNIWNCDECGKQFEHDPVRVVAEKGAKNVVGRTTGNRTNITIMACVNASGEKMPPMLITKGKTARSLHGFNTTGAPSGSIWTYQEKGWMTDELGEMWFRDIFLPNCGPSRPQILILDGHSSHETLSLLQLAVEENIHILSLPPHTTHALQPLDRSVFGPFNIAYNKACSNYMSENPMNLVNKWTFPGLFKEAWESALTQSNICSGFRSCGIHPFNPNAVSKEMMAPSKPTDKPQSTVPPTTSTISSPSTVPQTTSTISSPSTVPPTTSTISSPSPITATSSESAFTTSTPTVTFPNAPSTSQSPIALSFVSETPTVDNPVALDHSFDSSHSFLPLTPSFDIPMELLGDFSGDLEISELVPSELVESEVSISPEIFEADSEGVVNIMQPSGDNQISSIWDTTINSIFLPSPSPSQPAKKDSKKCSSHRLLTSSAVIALKQDMADKKAQKEEKKVKRVNKKKLSK